ASAVHDLQHGVEHGVAGIGQDVDAGGGYIADVELAEDVAHGFDVLGEEIHVVGLDVEIHLPFALELACQVLKIFLPADEGRLDQGETAVENAFGRAEVGDGQIRLVVRLLFAKLRRVDRKSVV